MYLYDCNRCIGIRIVHFQCIIILVEGAIKSGGNDFRSKTFGGSFHPTAKKVQRFFVRHEVFTILKYTF